MSQDNKLEALKEENQEQAIKKMKAITESNLI